MFLIASVKASHNMHGAREFDRHSTAPKGVQHVSSLGAINMTLLTECRWIIS